MGNKYLKISSVFFLIFQATTVFSQQTQKTDEPAPLIPLVKLGENVQVKFGGFVRAEYYFDSRETVGAVDDLFSFFPENVKKDPNSGDDMNAVFRNNLSSQATRFNALFTGPDVWKAKSSSFLEFDFTGGVAGVGTSGAGTSTGITNAVGLRLRHAWMKLSWAKGDLLVGKTWNPMSEIPFPSVIGLNTGIPFRPFGRGDQVRYTWKPNSTINVLAAAFFQSEHKSFIFSDAANTTAGISNCVDTRTNPIPDMHLQIHFKTPSLFAGIISEYKIVKPATQTTGTGGIFNANTTISSYALGAFADYKKNLFNVKASGLYGENLSELFQQGGYAVKTVEAVTGAKTYTASNSVTSWLNITYGNKLMAGLFAGYQKNLGFNDNILTAANGGAFLGRWQNVDHIYRVGPSLKYSIGRLVLAAEVEYNVAGYGTIDYNNRGKVMNSNDVSGVRGTLATTFLF